MLNTLLDISEWTGGSPAKDIDTTCPFCKSDGQIVETVRCAACLGKGERACLHNLPNGQHDPECSDPACEKGIIPCPECEGAGFVERSEPCQECSDGRFEIMWNTAFLVPYLKPDLAFEEARRLAFERGWLLFEHDHDLWLAAGSCGYDFTWPRAAAILEICGDLPEQYAEDLSISGAGFTSNEDRAAVTTAAIESLIKLAGRLGHHIGDLQHFAAKDHFDSTMQQQASHMRRIG